MLLRPPGAPLKPLESPYNALETSWNTSGTHPNRLETPWTTLEGFYVLRSLVKPLVRPCCPLKPHATSIKPKMFVSSINHANVPQAHRNALKSSGTPMIPPEAPRNVYNAPWNALKTTWGLERQLNPMKRFWNHLRNNAFLHLFLMFCVSCVRWNSSMISLSIF